MESFPEIDVEASLSSPQRMLRSWIDDVAVFEPGLECSPDVIRRAVKRLPNGNILTLEVLDPARVGMGEDGERLFTAVIEGVDGRVLAGLSVDSIFTYDFVAWGEGSPCNGGVGDQEILDFMQLAGIPH